MKLIGHNAENFIRVLGKAALALKSGLDRHFAKDMPQSEKKLFLL
jgi:hypothetical protein